MAAKRRSRDRKRERNVTPLTSHTGDDLRYEEVTLHAIEPETGNSLLLDEELPKRPRCPNQGPPLDNHRDSPIIRLIVEAGDVPVEAEPDP
jgi:hypothetical protein